MVNGSCHGGRTRIFAVVVGSRRSLEEELTDARSKGDRPTALSTALVTFTPSTLLRSAMMIASYTIRMMQNALRYHQPSAATSLCLKSTYTLSGVRRRYITISAMARSTIDVNAMARMMC